MDFSTIFNGESLTLEQFNERTASMKLADLSTGDYVAKGKAEDYKGKVKALEAQIAERDNTIAALEQAKGNAEAIQAELDKYRQAEAERTRKEQEAQADAILTRVAEEAIADKKFVNDYTRDHFVQAIKTALNDPANRGKGSAELFAEMTKDATGIFVNPQQELLKIAPVGGKNQHYTHEQIRAMTPDEINANFDAIKASLKGES